MSQLFEMQQEDSSKSRGYIITSILGLAWALFQLSLPQFVILDNIAVLSIHLAFALSIVFINVPMLKKSSRFKTTIPWFDILFCVGSICLVGYFLVYREDIAKRSGIPSMSDVVTGVIFVLLVIEAARRSIGIPMIILVLVFSIYAFFGPYMPAFMAFRGVSLGRYIGQVVHSSEGIFGIPLHVSAATVYLFVLFGSMLDKFGAGRFFNDTAIALLGTYRGGPAKASVISSGLTGLVSGSSIANVVTTGTFTIPVMKKVGYPARIAAAVEVAASTNGQLMPPIMGAAAFIIAEYVGIPYLSVVRAAIIPAFVSYAALFYITHLEACRLNIRKLKKHELPNLRDVMRRGGHHLIPISMLIFELAVLQHSPQLSVFRAILVMQATIIIREIIIARIEKKRTASFFRPYLKTLMQGLVGGSRNMLPVAMATAAAGIIVGIINMGIGSLIVQIVEYISLGNVFILLLTTAVMSLIIGMGLPTTATYVVMASITVPVILELGIGMGVVIPAIAAHLFCFYFGIIADDTPPVGIAAYTAAAIAKTKPVPVGITGFIYDLRTAIIPFAFVLNPILVLEGVTSFWRALTVFIAALIASMAFTSAVQNWMFIKNKWYETILHLAVTACLFFSIPLAEALGLPFKTEFPMYLIALILYALVIIIQKMRQRRLQLQEGRS